MKKKIMSSILCICLMLNFALFSEIFAVSVNAEETTVDNSGSVCQTEMQGSAMHLYSNKNHFSPGENVVVTYAIDSDSTISNIDYAQVGYIVRSAEIDSTGKYVTITASCPSGFVAYELQLQATLANGEILNASLYGISNSYGHFVSYASIDSAYEKYFACLLENGINTEEEIADMRAARYRALIDCTTIVTPASENPQITRAATANDTYVSGRLSWTNGNTSEGWTRGVKVELYDKKTVGSVLLATTHTDNYGYYSFAFENADDFLDFDNGGYDVFIRIYAGDNNARVYMENTITTPYYYESAVYEDIETGSTREFWVNFTSTDNLGKAVQISQPLITARDYAKTMIGSTPENVYVSYPYDSDEGSMYNILLNQIQLVEDPRASSAVPYAFASWDLIMHEYGHHIQTMLNMADWTSYTSDYEHTYSVNHADDRDDKALGIKIAWQEGWPTIFGMAAQNYYSSYIADAEFTNDGNYNAYNINSAIPIESCNIKLGEACEASVMAVLWDLYDSGSEANDLLYSTDSLFWSVTATHEFKTLSEFITYYYSFYPTDAPKLGVSLSYYQVAASTPTIATDYYTEVTPPSFMWQAQGGRSDSSDKNNEFNIVVYDSLGNLLLTCDTDYDYFYKLSITEWEYLMSLNISTVYVAVSAKQTHTPATGSYISGTVALTMP